GRPPDDTSKAELPLKGAMDMHPYSAAALLWRLVVAPVQCVRPIPKLNRVPALGGLEARKADITPFFPALEKGRKRTMQALNYLVGNDRWHIGIGHLVVALVLLVDVQVFSRRLKVSLPFSKRIIVQAAGRGQYLEQGGFLGAVRAHAVLENPFHACIV